MGDFGTGLRAHLGGARGAVVAEPPPPSIEPGRAGLDAERRRLEGLAGEPAARKLALVERGADLHAEQERRTAALARAQLQAARALDVEPPLDELAAARARRRR